MAKAPVAQQRAAEAVAVTGICAGYFGRDVLDRVTFSVDVGEFVGIIGPNGSGKSTLLKTIAGLHPLQCGEIRIFGLRPGAAAHRLVGYVPQVESVNWSFPVTVFDVVLMGRFGNIGLFRRPGREDRSAAMAALAQVGMADRADSQIGRLSGGQQQRVFIARALVQDPKLLLLDEPIAGVDATSQHAIFTLLEERQRAGMTVIASTHDLSCVAMWFDRVLCLNHRVVAYGTPGEVLNDETLSSTYGSHMLTIPQAGR
ncbi:MAG: metal ABC transporter ATP-binding protein [Candidatus Eremiobacteraeota bacterium]|nr:metal ABC transporter ATP-binding protein [Candidatus Eremiobacteraeota bacterium]MBC5827032.1 metal ABC transporter ATP-binding protein [Candidatus Eremiobacteraeota bacterium]